LILIMAVFVDLHLPGRATSRHLLPFGRSLLGTSRECAVLVPHEAGLPPFVLRLLPTEEGVELSLPDQSPLRLSSGGSTSTTLRAPFGEDVFLGPLRLVFLRQKAGKTSPVFLLGVGALAALILALLLSSGTGESAELAARPTAPSLLPPPQDCWTLDQEPPVDAAVRLSRAAHSHSERAPFAHAEAVLAVRLHAQALACLKGAQSPALLEEEQALLAKAEKELQDDYTALRLQLRRALDAGETRSALRASRALLLVLKAAEIPPEDKFLRWLQLVHQRLTGKMDGKKS